MSDRPTIDGQEGPLADLHEAVKQEEVARDTNGFAEISFKVKGEAATSLLKLLAFCKSIGDMGHSFPIIIDPETREFAHKVDFCGEEDDRVKDIRINGKALPKDFGQQLGADS